MDNMSIDQNNQTDVATQVAVMGEIYGRAECVSVLLPESDKEAYEIGRAPLNGDNAAEQKGAV